jgi:FkbM family methyltransferase
MVVIFAAGMFAAVCGYPAPDPVKVFMKERRSQHGEDLYVFQEFYQSNLSRIKAAAGVYIEAGALDGRDLSNTWALNKAFGWTGILIEASPALFKSLQKNRQGSGDVLVHGALCNPKDARRNVTYHYVDNEVKNTAVGGIWELMDEGFKEAFYKRFAIDDAKLQTYPTVKCMSLASELHSRGVHHVDYFSLDIEGAELNFLSHFSYALHKGNVTIDIISVEGYGDSVTPKDMQVRVLLNGVGYTFVGWGVKQPAYGWGSMWFLRNASAVHVEYFGWNRDKKR